MFNLLFFYLSLSLCGSSVRLSVRLSDRPSVCLFMCMCTVYISEAPNPLVVLVDISLSTSCSFLIYLHCFYHRHRSFASLSSRVLMFIPPSCMCLPFLIRTVCLSIAFHVCSFILVCLSDYMSPLSVSLSFFSVLHLSLCIFVCLRLFVHHCEERSQQTFVWPSN